MKLFQMLNIRQKYNLIFMRYTNNFLKFILALKTESEVYSVLFILDLCVLFKKDLGSNLSNFFISILI